MKIESMWGDLDLLNDFSKFEFMAHDYSKKHPYYSYEYFDMKSFTDCRITFEINLEDRSGKALEWEVRKLIMQDCSEHMI